MINEEITYTKLLNYVRGWLEGRQYYTATKALDFARSRTTGTRKDGLTPSFSHQLHIARFFMNIARLLKDPEKIITVIFLHDIVEDNLATLAEIEETFGKPYAEAVKKLTKLNGGIKLPDEIYYNDMLVDAEVCLAKGGDRMHNLESMAGVFTAEKKQIYIEETENNTLPMLKCARNLYPEYADAFNLIRHTLIIYTKLIREEFKSLSVTA